MRFVVGAELLDEPLAELRRAWSETSWRMRRLRDDPDCADEELAAAVAKIEEAEAARATAQERIDTLVSLELQARNWADRQKALAAARQKLANAESLLGTAVAPALAAPAAY